MMTKPETAAFSKAVILSEAKDLDIERGVRSRDPSLRSYSFVQKNEVTGPLKRTLRNAKRKQGR